MQALDQPATRRPRRRCRRIEGRHLHGKSARRHFINLHFNEATRLKIGLNGVQRHAT